MTQTPNESISPSVALVLGSGGARGIAHLGVLQALQELHLEPGIVVGTSIGALAGAAYATGSVETLREDFLAMTARETAALFVEPNIPRSGLIEGRHLMEKLAQWIPDVEISRLRIAYAAVAFDITSQVESVQTTGRILSAIRASISIPGYFSPVQQGSGWLVDGGLSNPLPVSVAKSMGADRVLAVDINLCPGMPLQETQEENKFLRIMRTLTGGAPTLVEVLMQSIRVAENAIERERLQEDLPDVLLSPPVGHIPTLDFRNPEALIQLGYDTAMQHKEEIIDLFQKSPT